MKNILKFFFASIVFTNILFFNAVIASECDVCVYDQGGCIIDNTPDNATNYGTICNCGSGLVCSRTGATQGCSCQKALGSGLFGVAESSSLGTETTMPEIIGNVIRVILSISGTVALIFIIWGGIKWMISKGKEDSIKEARKLMTSGMIGIAIIAAAYAITDFVIKQITVVAGA